MEWRNLKSFTAVNMIIFCTLLRLFIKKKLNKMETEFLVYVKMFPNDKSVNELMSALIKEYIESIK